MTNQVVYVTLPRSGMLRKLGMVVLGVGTHTPEQCRNGVLRVSAGFPCVTGRVKGVFSYQRLRNHLLVCVR